MPDVLHWIGLLGAGSGQNGAQSTESVSNTPGLPPTHQVFPLDLAGYLFSLLL